ncbi:hypothetical protein HZA87_05015 [Candidatus Uhrbacteria bacterium]|nr:hypothetical protein [Candidatus Uhrbacteria bacterium]
MPHAVALNMDDAALTRDRRAAYHEAGHTLAVLEQFPQWFHSVSIELDEHAGGRTLYDGGLTDEGLTRICETWKPQHLTAYVKMHVAVAVSGYLGQAFCGDDVVEHEVAQDMMEVTRLVLVTSKARGVDPEDEDDLVTFIDEGKAFKSRVIAREETLMRQLAHDLFVDRTLDRAHVLSLYQRLWRGRKIDLG